MPTSSSCLGVIQIAWRCLRCETVTARDEHFFDLSIDIEPNQSVSSCMRNFTASERLNRNDKFHCDVCCAKTEAERRMRLKRLPRTLALHLKRFKFVEQLQRHQKLNDRVSFPFELRVVPSRADSQDAEGAAGAGAGSSASAASPSPAACVAASPSPMSPPQTSCSHFARKRMAAAARHS